MRSKFVLIPLLLLALGLSWKWPLFHVQSLSAVRAAQAAAEFRPADAADKFWRNDRLEKISAATDARAFLAALDQDPSAAKEKFGRPVGLGRVNYLFTLRGTGVVTPSDVKGIAVRVGDSAATDFYFPAAPIFGNVVRDATGVFLASQFTNSQQFNDISRELNQRVEQKLLTLLNDVKEGQTIEFVGCLEISPGQTPRRPFKLIPLDLKVE